jgi:hypothetical protein
MRRVSSPTSAFVGTLIAGRAEVTISARVVDETGEAVAGARVELRTPMAETCP